MNSPSDEHLRLSLGGRHRFMLFASLLFLIAVLLVAAGTNAIQQQQWDFRWRMTRGIGPAAWGNQGTIAYRDLEAIRSGLGLISGGAMLITWGVAILLSALGSGTSRTLRGRLGVALAGLSLMSLLIVCSCFFPPWRLWCAGFYGVIVLVSLIVGLRLRSGTPSRWGVVTFPVLTGSALVASWVRPDVSVGIVLGLFAAIGGWAHLGVLVPCLLRRFGLSRS
jgi:hypothetical protein